MMIFAGVCFGCLSSTGIFTLLAAVGLVPRFAGQTHTARHIMLYEETVVAGTIFGCLLSVFPEYCELGMFLNATLPAWESLWNGLGIVLQLMFGLFSGMFVGCLALAIAEMLDSIPIFARRAAFRHGLGLVVLSMAAAKLVGSLLYFIYELHRSVETCGYILR